MYSLSLSGSCHTWEWEHVTIAFQALTLVEKAEPVQIHFTLLLKEHEYELDVKSAWIHSYMASNGSFFMVIGTTSKNHLLDVGLSQDRKIMTLRTLTILNLLSIYHVWGPHEYTFIEIIAFGWGPRSQTTSRYTLESVTTLSYMNGLWTLTFFRALTISWSQLVARWPLI